MVEEKSLRDELSAAFETQVETPTETVKEPETTVVETPAIEDKSSEGTVRESVVDNSAATAVDVVDNTEGVDGGKSKPALASVDAPVSLKAVEKAEWAKAPKAIQEAFVRREAEVQTALRQSAESRKFADEFGQVMNPYMPLIRASNSTPMVAVKNLMMTAAGLTLGTPQQKAQIIRDIIQNYGIDLKTLDDVLANNLPTDKKAPGTSDVEVQVQKAIAPIYEFMNGLQQQRQTAQQRQVQDAETAVQKFAAQHEFFEDVREDVADLMEMAANRGREMSMKQAYDLAIEGNPTLKAAAAQRKAAQGSGAADRAQRASLSLSGAPRSAPAADPSNNSLRDDLMNAMNRVAGS